ncbi:MAG: hypothetical protein PVI09_02790 [Anaerolineae bacterium]|jgi:hypothetical protein
MRHGWHFLLLGLVLLALAGCSFNNGAMVDADQPLQSQAAGLVLEPGQPVGQTFVARHAGLAGIEFFLRPAGDTPSELVLHVRTDPLAASDLRSAAVTVPAGAQPGFYRFSFPSLSGSHGQYYYAFLDSRTPGATVAQAGGGAYLDGAAHQAHQPLDAQTAFRLAYAPGPLLLDLFFAALQGIGLLLVASWLLVVPGWALLAWLLPDRQLNWAERLGLSAGVGLSLYPLLFLWTDLVGLHLGALYAWLPPLLGLVALVWRYRTWRPAHGWRALRQWARTRALWPDLALLVLLGLVFGVRLLVVRSLDVPMWGDSYQHTMIVQLLADNGGLFDSWLPYAAIDRFAYHFGFHSVAAAFHWITGQPAIDTTLAMGQLLNGLAVVALYPLAVRVTGSRWGGVWAMLLAGLLSPMPMFFVNWGRYTQLAGLTILPAAVWLTWEIGAISDHKWRPLALVALVVAGLSLTHYRVLIFYVLFVVVLLPTLWRRETWRETTLRFAAVALGSGLLVLPWFVRTFGASLAEIFWKQATTLPSQANSFTWTYNALGDPSSFLALGWWVAMIVGLGLGLWLHRRNVLVAGLWWLLLLIVTNPAWFNLPGTGIITNFALFISIYIPAGLFFGVLAAQLAQSTAKKQWARVLVALCVVLLGLWGFRDRMGDLHPESHALATRPDLRAAAWIQANTPPESRFWVNSFFAFGGGAVVGSDGGWWLPLLASRSNTVPPLNYSTDLPADSAYRQQINALQLQVKEQGLDNPAVIARLCEDGITHVYIGQRQGKVNAPADQAIDPQQLLANSEYELVYRQDRVWIFALCP